MRRDVPRRVFRGRELPMVAAQAAQLFGDDAVILGTRSVRVRGETLVEIVAAASDAVERFQRRLTPPDGPARAPGAGRPRVVALVGPTGAGKTTTAAKLALHADAYGGRRVGFVTCDTYRAGAVAQLELYADVAGIPLEVVYDAGDAAGALARLADRDVVLVDTPGRSPREDADDDGWRATLDALAPDEVHLVLPATIRPDVAEAMRERFAPPADADGGAPASTPGAGRAAATHLLLTKLDELPGDLGLTELAASLDLPVRWIAEGQEIPRDLAPGVPRLVRALGAFGTVSATPAGSL